MARTVCRPLTASFAFLSRDSKRSTNSHFLLRASPRYCKGPEFPLCLFGSNSLPHRSAGFALPGTSKQTQDSTLL